MSRDPAGSTRSYTEDFDAGENPRPRPHLFLVLECHHPLALPARFSLDALDEVSFGRSKARTFRRATGNPRLLEIRLEDDRASSQHARIRRSGETWTLHDAASKNGSFVNGVRQSEVRLADGDILEIGHTFFLFRQSVVSAPESKPTGAAESGDGHGRRDPTSDGDTHLSSMVPALQQLYRDIRSRATSDLSMLVEGETGTGKEVMARAVHAMSGRKGKLVPINCGELKGDLVEANLFGYRRGAFTGARDDHQGLVRSADRGTLFLDEIGDLPLPQQALWLRVLQERKVRPLGSDADPTPVDLRVVAATNRPLDEMVKTGHFRQDLLQRLTGHRVRLPPLRERREDMGLLLAAFLRRAGRESIQIQSKAALAMLLYDWPGNVRELENCVAAALTVAGERVETRHLPEAVRAALDREAEMKAAAKSALRDKIVALLVRHEGNVSAVAREMEKDRAQIWRWLKGFEIDPEAYRR